ncbi:MAG TPA: universal stress protein [Gaiellaceae bacterium]|nr:universal stress protein [Gaiellaceae bacterium]
MGPIVVSVDESDGARAALRVAGDLAEALSTTLVLVHVAPRTEAPGVSTAPAGQQRLREAELEDARELLQRVASEAGLGDDVQQRAEIGSAADRIVALCAELDASFVVLGSRGRGGLKSAVLGSVSNHVASNAPCPVVIVPPSAV